MIFRGITKSFCLIGEKQYETIGAFWDEMAKKYGLENLRGLGYLWHKGVIHYAIGLKCGDIDGHNFELTLPDEGWTEAVGRTDDLKELYDSIYRSGALKYEIEYFFDDGHCEIKYIR